MSDKQCCLMCDNLDRGNDNGKGKIYCKAIKDFVDMIAPQCEEFIYIFERKENNEQM